MLSFAVPQLSNYSISHIWEPLVTFSFIYLAVRTVAARVSRSPDSTRVSCREEDGRGA